MLKKHFLTLLVGLTLVAIFSCSKDDDPGKLYIRFKLDGDQQNFSGSENSINTGFGPDVSTSSGFFDFETNIDISLSMEQDSITEQDLKDLIGQKIKVPHCFGVGCGTSMDLNWDINGDYYSSSGDDNPFPQYYFQINKVEYLRTVEPFDVEYKQLIVEGVFELNISHSSDVKSLSDGEFRLIFEESFF